MLNMRNKLLSIILIFFLGTAAFSEDKSETFVVEAVTEDETVSAAFEMVKIPGKNYFVGKTEVTCEVYEIVMGENPSSYAEGNFPVNTVSWYDCIVFCNRLSILLGKIPVYSVNGSTNPDDWDYSPHGGSAISGEVVRHIRADGFRLLTVDEWEYAANGGQNFKYSGSDNPDEVAWFKDNSDYKSHEVATKSPNGYGLYDMSGNLWEWCWDKFKEDSNYYRIHKGGSVASGKELCEIKFSGHHYGSRSQPCYSYFSFGFRIVRNLR